jgi:NitT/TauT family transport system permease protein
MSEDIATVLDTPEVAERPASRRVAPQSNSANPLVDVDELAEAGARRVVVRRRRSRVLVLISQVVLAVAVIALWQIASTRKWINPLFYSRPSAIWTFLVDERSLFMHNAYATFRATVVGLVLGGVAGIIVGLVLARAQFLNRVLDPFLMALNSLPRIALVPLFLLWFGITFEAKVANAVTLVFFILLINTRAGIIAIDKDLVLEGRLLHGSSSQIYRKIFLPAALPAIASGLRLGVTYALLGVIASEMVASRDGLGQQVTLYGQTLRSDGVFATLLVLALIATVLLALVKRLEAFVKHTHTT